MRTEKVKLFGTYFFCVLQTRQFSVRANILIFKVLSIVKTKISRTFAMSNDEDRKRNGSDSFQ